ncbi:MAG: class I SAM-dependent methyltransferase [Alphaproteobacteria bacterium]
MSSKTLNMSDALHAFLMDATIQETKEQIALRDATASHPSAGMQISPEQGQLMKALIAMLGARRAIEVGTFTGYSALTVALALPADGKLVACDVSDEYTRVGRPFWDQAKVADKIDLRLGAAIDTLDAMIAAGESGTYDFAFIDADKENYDGYYERCLTLLRPGGVVAIDNAIWGGAIADPSKTDSSTEAIRAVDRKAGSDDRVISAMVPIGDGLMLAVKKS